MTTYTYKNNELLNKTKELGYNTITTKFVPDKCSVKTGLEYESVKRAVNYITEALGYKPFAITEYDEMEDIIEDYLDAHKDLVVSSLLLKRLQQRNTRLKPYTFYSRIIDIKSSEFVVHKSDIERLRRIEALLANTNKNKSIIVGVEHRNGQVTFIACNSLDGNVFNLLKNVNVVFLEVYRLDDFVSKTVSTKYIVPSLGHEINVYDEEDFIVEIGKLRSKSYTKDYLK